MGAERRVTYPVDVEGSGGLGSAGGEMKTMGVVKGASAHPEGMLARGWNSAMNFVDARVGLALNLNLYRLYVYL